MSSESPGFSGAGIVTTMHEVALHFAREETPCLFATRRYPKDEFARRGNEICELHVRPQVEAENRGKYVAINIETGDWEMDASERRRVPAFDSAFPTRRPG